MEKYQKIDTLYLFDNQRKRFIEGKYTNPYVEYLKDCSWIGSEKIDGTNIRVQWDGYGFSILGRKDDSSIPKELIEEYNNVFNKDMEIAVEQIFHNKKVIFFMEGYGGKIQGGIYGGSERFIGFDIMVEGFYLDRSEAGHIYQNLGLPTMDIMEFPNLNSAIDYVRAGNYSKHSLDKETIIEGLVLVPKVRIYDNQGNRIAVKVKYRDLLKTVKE